MARFCELLGMYLASVVFCLPFSCIAFAFDPSPLPAVCLIVSGPLLLTGLLAKLDSDGLLDE